MERYLAWKEKKKSNLQLSWCNYMGMTLRYFWLLHFILSWFIDTSGLCGFFFLHR